MLEQRRIERFDAALPAIIRTGEPYGEGEEALTLLLTKNICEMGAYFCTSQPLSKGTKVRVDLLFPLSELSLKQVKEGEAQISVDGTVSRSKLIGMAISFSKSYAIVALSS